MAEPFPSIYAEMNIAAFTETVNNLGGLISLLPPIGAVLFILAALWSIYRTGSAHLLRLRAWRLFYGNADPRNRAISRFVQNRSDLMSVRWMTGMRHIRSLPQAQRLLAWLDALDEDVDLIAPCGRSFDLELLRVRGKSLPGWRTQALLWCIFVLLAVPAAIATVAAGSELAAFKIKASGTWFLASPGSEPTASIGKLRLGNR